MTTEQYILQAAAMLDIPAARITDAASHTRYPIEQIIMWLQTGYRLEDIERYPNEIWFLAATSLMLPPLPPLTEDDLKIWGSPERPDEKIFD